MSKFSWRVSGQVNDVGGSPVMLLPCFEGTLAEALQAGWQQDTTPELLCVWAARVNPHALNKWGQPEKVILTNCEGELRFHWGSDD